MSNTNDRRPIGYHIPENQTTVDDEYYSVLRTYCTNRDNDILDCLMNFPKYAPRSALGRFLVKHELFKQILNVHGNIIECGVFKGGGLFTWAQLSAIQEPLNHIRRIVGFDTFEGFPDNPSDCAGMHQLARQGCMCGSIDDLKEAIEIYDYNRPIRHIPKVELVPGDARQSIPAYVDENKHLVVALLYLDFDVYEPTRVAIETFLPRMPKGAVLAFDELNQKNWPGETQAVLDTIGIRNLRIQRFPYQPQLSYAILE